MSSPTRSSASAAERRRAIDEDVLLFPSDPFRFGVERFLDGVAAYLAALDREQPHVVTDEWGSLDPAELAGHLAKTKKSV